jgi:pimeloyl-ACP methyl ester carboxylesterase
VELNVDLTVVAGDIEKTDVIGRLAVFFTDLYYTDEHDLVVQTPAMYGGPVRPEGRYFFHKGPGVHHSSYFSNKRTAEIVREALTVPLKQLGAKGFRPLKEAYVEAVPEFELVSRSYQKSSYLPQPVVYILPGIMGSHLSENGNRIWLDILDMAMGKVANLRIDNNRVQPDALVGLAYANLVEYLSGTHEVIPFPYDWRLSIVDEAERFAKALEAKLDETDQPIRIVAHSMGGLVARAMIGQHPEIWEKITQRDGSRFVMLGTPNRGSYQIPRLILGQEKTFRMLAMLDLRNSGKQLLEVISRFPGVLQLLPMDGAGTWNFLEADTWDKFPNTGRRKWVKPQAKDLEQARQFHEFLEAGKKSIGDWDKVLYVAGYGRGAPIGLELDDKNDILFQGTNRGDGTVPWETGILPELEKDRTYYMDAPHGDLANHKDSFPAIFDLLNEGSTSQLSKTPPRFDRSVEDRYILPTEDVDIYPSQLDLEATALGASPIHQHQTPSTRLVRVSVVHGDLSFCEYPVAVGHYEGDGFYSAEKALDHHLNDRLSARLKLGLYPGAEGTAEVILNDKSRMPGGAIIVGLGKVGELSPMKLSKAVANALREYGIMAFEKGLADTDGEIALSTVLIGAGGSGPGLSIRGSIDAILSGVNLANKSFVEFSSTHVSSYNIRIGEIQFVELYKDKAILAVKALQPHTDSQEYKVSLLLQHSQGGWERSFNNESLESWNRVYVQENENRSLMFSIPTIRARAEQVALNVQERNIDRLIKKEVGNSRWDKTLARTMFELMIPKWLKESLSDFNNIVFALDQKAASYPWELIYDPETAMDSPLVVQVGFIRQFSTASFQERVHDEQNNRVVVIGNPAGITDNFPNLPGAASEARTVANMFEKHCDINGNKIFSVDSAINADSTTIMNKIFSQDFRILHLAGHGVLNYRPMENNDNEPEIYTGMVLEKDVYLTANEIKNKKKIPELVFINCCYLGVLDSTNKQNEAPYDFNVFAASLSQEFIEMGVKAVVAAGWAVDDLAAKTFAEKFYDSMLKGKSFGDAVKNARRETYRLHGETNTWAAYQCYGSPAYTLTKRESGNVYLVDIDEAFIEIHNLYEMAKTASEKGLEWIRANLMSFSEYLEQNHLNWMIDAKLLEAFGKAFGEAYWFEEAVKYYDRAIGSGESTAAIMAVEQSANFHVRLAVQRFNNDPAEYGRSKAKIEAQIKRIEKLMDALGETPERWSIVGSGYKRLAQVTAGRSQTACNSALKSMESAYAKAWELKRTREGKEDPYPLINALIAASVQLLRSKEPDKVRIADLKHLVEEAKSLAEKKRLASSDDFWARTGEAEAELVEQFHTYLSKGGKKFSRDVHDKLVRVYDDAWKQYGSARQLNSIIEHYAFLVAVLGKSERYASLREELERILKSLQEMFEAAD